MYSYRDICALIPIFNEEIVIEDTITALEHAGFAKSDIYVVDDKSTDDTAAIATSLGVSVYTVPENGGKARAQVAALQYFQLTQRYKWIVFLDGDTKVDVNFLTEMYNASKKYPKIGLFVGQVKSVKNTHVFSASRAYDYTYGQDLVKTGQSKFNVIFVSPGCASMYRSDLLDTLEIDHSTLAEDMDLTMQCHRAGHRVRYIPSAFVNTQDPGSFKDYHKQVLRWYRGFWQVIKKHGIFSLRRKQPVDWYMMLITLDAVIFNRIVWIFILSIISMKVLLLALLFDIGVAAIIALYVSFRTERLDTIYKFPVYYWLSYVNFYAYLRSFIEIIIQRKELLAWNKVKRYTFNLP